jgi:hypothetical protein
VPRVDILNANRMKRVTACGKEGCPIAAADYDKDVGTVQKYHNFIMNCQVELEILLSRLHQAVSVEDGVDKDLFVFFPANDRQKLAWHNLPHDVVTYECATVGQKAQNQLKLLRDKEDTIWRAVPWLTVDQSRQVFQCMIQEVDCFHNNGFMNYITACMRMVDVGARQARNDRARELHLNAKAELQRMGREHGVNAAAEAAEELDDMALHHYNYREPCLHEYHTINGIDNNNSGNTSFASADEDFGDEGSGDPTTTQQGTTKAGTADSTGIGGQSEVEPNFIIGINGTLYFSA